MPAGKSQKLLPIPRKCLPGFAVDQVQNYTLFLADFSPYGL